MCRKLGVGNPYRVPGGRSPIEINPKLRIHKGSNNWYQSIIFNILLPFHSRPSSLHNCSSNSHNCLDHHRILPSSSLTHITF
ncbi:hypothetical protein GW17_00054054 [Ensete ventricosum]|nr:hypothetical protein GW17_00054054 [Ensete ventricosum]